MNPQFHIQIPRSPSLSKCHVVVSVTQQYETNTGDPKKRKKRKLHHIGFAVYEVPPHMTRLTPLYVAEHVSTYLEGVRANLGMAKKVTISKKSTIFLLIP